MAHHYDEDSNLNSKEARETRREAALDALAEARERQAAPHYSSVDAATVPSPSQYNDKLNAALRPLPLPLPLPQTYCIACGSIYHTAPICPQNNTAMAGTAGVRPSGVPCPNCQQLGPHMCPAHDALRWAQQEEFNLATARKLRQIDTLLPGKSGYHPTAAQVQVEIAQSIRNYAEIDTQAAADREQRLAEMEQRLKGIQKRLNNTPASAVEQAAADIKEKWAELQRTLNQRFQAMQDHINSRLNTLTNITEQACAAIGSDAPAAAASSSPEFDTFCDEMVEWKRKVESLINARFSTSDQTFVNHATRLTALEAGQRKAHVTAWESAPKVAVSGAWIACSERMPTPAEYVIALTRDGRIFHAYCNAWGVWITNDHYEIQDITHWLALPPTPANPAI